MPTFTLEDVKKREKPSWTLENAGKKAPTLTREIVEKTIDDVVNTYGGDANLAALLKETAAQESHFGKLAPKNVMQLTPIHLKEMRKLKYKPMLAVLGAKYTPEGNLDAKDLRTNVILALMRYQTAKGFKGASAKQSERAQQWKNFYNTKKGAGTVGKYKQTLKDLGLFEEEKNWSFLNPLAVKEAYAEERPSFTLEPVEPSKKQFGFTLEDVKPAKKSAIINEAKKFFSQKQIAMEAGRRAIPHYLKWETETLQPALKYFFTRDIEKAKKPWGEIWKETPAYKKIPHPSEKFIAEHPVKAFVPWLATEYLPGELLEMGTRPSSWVIWKGLEKAIPAVANSALKIIAKKNPKLYQFLTKERLVVSPQAKARLKGELAGARYRILKKLGVKQPTALKPLSEAEVKEALKRGDISLAKAIRQSPELRAEEIAKRKIPLTGEVLEKPSQPAKPTPTVAKEPLKSPELAPEIPEQRVAPVSPPEVGIKPKVEGIPKEIAEEAKPTKPKPPKAPTSLITVVKQHGGVDPENLKALGYDIKTDIQEHGLLSILKKGGNGLDDIATELASEGVINIPPDETPSSYLLHLLQSKEGRKIGEIDWDKKWKEYELNLPEAETPIKTDEYRTIETIVLRPGYKVIRNGEEYIVKKGKEPGTLLIENGETLELDDTFDTLDAVDNIIPVGEEPPLKTPEPPEKPRTENALLDKQASQYIKNINSKTRKPFTKLRDSYKIIDAFGKAGIIEGNIGNVVATSIQGLIDKIRQTDTLPALETLLNNIKKADYPKTQQAVLLAEYYLRRDALAKTIEAEKANNKFRIEKLGGLKRVMTSHPSELSQIKSKINKLAVAYYNPQFMDLQREIKGALDAETAKFIKKICAVELRKRGAKSHLEEVANEMYLLYAEKLWRNYSPAMEGGLAGYINASVAKRIDNALDRIRGVSPAQAQDMRKLEELIREFSYTNERPPTVDEIATAFKWSREKTVAVLDNIKLSSPASIDAPINPETELTYGEVLQAPAHYDQKEMESFELLIREAEDFIKTQDPVSQSIFRAVMSGEKFEAIAKTLKTSVPEVLKKWDKIGLNLREYIKENPDRKQAMVEILTNLNKKMHQRENIFYNNAGFVRIPSKEDIDNALIRLENYAQEVRENYPHIEDNIRKTLYYASRACRLAQVNTLFEPVFNAAVEEGVSKVEKLRTEVGKLNYQRKIALRKGANIRSHYIKKNYKKALKESERLLADALVRGRAIMRYFTGAELKEQGFNEGEIEAYKWMVKLQKLITELHLQIWYEKLGLKDPKFTDAINSVKELLGWDEDRIGLASRDKLQQALLEKAGSLPPEETLKLLETWREKYQHLQAISARFHDGWVSMQRLMDKDGYHWAVIAKHSPKTYQLTLEGKGELPDVHRPPTAWFETFESRKEALARKQDLIARDYEDVQLVRTQEMSAPANALKYREYLSIPALQSVVDDLSAKRILTDEDKALIDELEETIRDKLTPGYLKKFRWVKGWHTKLEEINKVVVNSFESASMQLARLRVKRATKPLLKAIQDSKIPTSHTLYNFATRWVAENFISPSEKGIEFATIRRLIYTYFIGPKPSFSLLQFTQNYILGVPAIARWLTLQTGNMIKSGVEANIAMQKAIPQALNYTIKMHLNAVVHHLIDGISRTFPDAKRKQILEWWEKHEQIHPDINAEARSQIRGIQKTAQKLKKGRELDPDVKAMLDKQTDRGLTNANMAEFLMSLESGALEPTLRQKIVRLLNFIPMSTEVFNRNLTLITILNLAKKHNIPFDDNLITSSRNIIYDSHFLYHNMNNPLFLSCLGPLKGMGKLLYIFFSFYQEFGQAMFNAAGQMIQSGWNIGVGGRKLSPAEREKEVRRFKANANWMLNMHLWMLFWGGIRALPAIGLLIWFLRRKRRKNLDEEVRKMALDKWQMPPQVAQTWSNVIMAGVPNMLGINMSNSVSWDWNNVAIAGLYKRLVRGWKKLQRNDSSGWEDVLPVFASSLWRSLRYGEEGGIPAGIRMTERLRERQGIYGIDRGKLPLNRFELILKALAFPLSKEHQLWKWREDPLYKDKLEQQSIFAERMARAELEGDAERIDAIRKQIARYNSKITNPELEINIHSSNFKKSKTYYLQKLQGL